MDSTKYIGMDVHQASISVAVRNGTGDKHAFGYNRLASQTGQCVNMPTGSARDRLKTELYERLKSLDRDAFRAEIRLQRDDHLLGDLRYEFKWDPDPRKSTWQAIEINRLITERKRRREALPQWIGIVVGNLIALAALIVSIVALYKK